MSNFFFFNTTRKYILGLLNTFNDIRTLRTDPITNISIQNIVPLSFSTKDKVFVMNETDVNQMKTGNYNFLPRMALVYTGIEPDYERNTNRYAKINLTTSTGGVSSYQMNSVAYNFKFELQIATRSLIDLFSIYEQVLPFFNPYLTLNVDELSSLSEPSLIKVFIDTFDIDLPDEISIDDDIRICTANLKITLKGNLFPPIKDGALIESINLSIGTLPESLNIADAIVPIEMTGLKNTNLTITDYNSIYTGRPLITNIASTTLTPLLGSTVSLQVYFVDPKFPISNHTFQWSCSDNIVTDYTMTNNNNIIHFTPLVHGTFTIYVTVTDGSGNASLSHSIVLVV